MRGREKGGSEEEEKEEEERGKNKREAASGMSWHAKVLPSSRPSVVRLSLARPPVCLISSQHRPGISGRFYAVLRVT